MTADYKNCEVVEWHPDERLVYLPILLLC